MKYDESHFSIKLHLINGKMVQPHVNTYVSVVPVPNVPNLWSSSQIVKRHSTSFLPKCHHGEPDRGHDRINRFSGQSSCDGRLSGIVKTHK